MKAYQKPLLVRYRQNRAQAGEYPMPSGGAVRKCNGSDGGGCGGGRAFAPPPWGLTS